MDGFFASGEENTAERCLCARRKVAAGFRKYGHIARIWCIFRFAKKCTDRSRISTVRSGLSGLPDETSSGRFASRTPEGPRRKRRHSRTVNIMNIRCFLQSFELGSSPFGQRRKTLTVPALRRLFLLAEDQTPGVQTIQFKPDAL